MFVFRKNSFPLPQPLILCVCSAVFCKFISQATILLNMSVCRCRSPEKFNSLFHFLIIWTVFLQSFVTKLTPADFSPVPNTTKEKRNGKLCVCFSPRQFLLLFLFLFCWKQSITTTAAMSSASSSFFVVFGARIQFFFRSFSHSKILFADCTFVRSRFLSTTA